ncbi:MAG: YihY/virulence factor BrkB family protein [Anaerolineae bacterium]|nr:YihY/virulence factor BrkB family protein [Anaerolineae bacterium]MBL6966419.1 YihY/virulence factor BrkB family protein [Anaerolineales bacterium]
MKFASFQSTVRRVWQKSISIARILNHAFMRMGEERVAEAAAGLAFYSFFSLFPLLLMMVAFGGRLVESADAQVQALKLLVGMFPFAGDVIEKNIQQVLEARGSVSMLSTLALAWSGSAAFAILARYINLAWPAANRRPFITRRLMALLILLALLLLIALTLTANTIIRLLPPGLNGAAQVLLHMRYFSHVVLWIMLFITLVTLYRWLPNTHVLWREGAWGAFVASLAAEIITWGFAWYLKSGFANYSLVYGSLSAIAALLFWIYLLGTIILFGAHLGASIAHHAQSP